MPDVVNGILAASVAVREFVPAMSASCWLLGESCSSPAGYLQQMPTPYEQPVSVALRQWVSGYP